MQGVSVIICCHNSEKRLPETLRFLALQEVPSYIPWEIIVVDNASTDNTVGKALEAWSKSQSDVSFKVVKQPKSGLSFAREKGLDTAQFEYCLFCDDDNWLDKNYVRLAYEIMSSNECIGVLGGLGEAICEIEAPHWFENVKHAYAVGPQCSYDGDVTEDRGFVFGAGAVLRRSVFLSLRYKGIQLLLSDRNGKKLSSGGDAEICYLYVLNGYKIFYSSKLKFQHFIPKERLTIEYYKKLTYGFTQARIILSLYKYKMSCESNLLKKGLWLREFIYSLKNELFVSKPDKVKFRRTYAFALIKNRDTFNNALKYLRGYSSVKVDLCQKD